MNNDTTKILDFMKYFFNVAKTKDESVADLCDEMSGLIDKYIESSEDEDSNDHNSYYNIYDRIQDRYNEWREENEPTNITLSPIMLPYDVVNGLYYNEKKDSFEYFPFMVADVTNDLIRGTTTLDLIGLKFIDYGIWSAKKDDYRFVFLSPYPGCLIEDAYIPSEATIESLHLSYEGSRSITALGSSYWTCTPDNYAGARYVDPFGNIRAGSRNNKFGYVPYISVGL